jgi:hypothetical protein
VLRQMAMVHRQLRVTMHPWCYLGCAAYQALVFSVAEVRMTWWLGGMQCWRTWRHEAMRASFHDSPSHRGSSGL